MSKTIDDNTVIIFTDGSYKRATETNKEKCGYGIYFPNKECPDVSKSFKNKLKTNQRAELYAIYKALSCVLKSKDKNTRKKNIHIYTDSEYSIKSLTVWISNWIKNDWKSSTGKEVMNRDLIEPIYKILKKNPDKVFFTHINSHTGKKDFYSLGNEMADTLANEACK